MKKPIAVALATAAIALGAALPGSASAQRVIEETLILRDPTVAAPRNWLVGAAGEFWYVSGEYNIYDQNDNIIAEGDIDYKQTGWNAYAGYGDFTVLFTSRSGDGDLNFTYAPGALGLPQSVSTTGRVDQEDREILVRWIFLKRPHFAPYVVAGYSWTDYEQTETITTPGVIWTATGNATRRETIEYTAPLVGLGAIIPVNERLGFRVDGRIKFYSADRTQSGLPSDSGDGVGGDLTGTAYFNIFEGLNAQIGGRFTHLDAGDAGGTNSRWGWFAMLGYTHRF
jgi:hypothetical protein